MSESFEPGERSTLKIEEEMQNEPFILDAELLQEYPELTFLSGLSHKDAPEETFNVSQIYFNGKAIESFIKSIAERKETGNIAYLNKIIKDGLNKLEALNEPKYAKFIENEKQKMEKRKDLLLTVIGKLV